MRTRTLADAWISVGLHVPAGALAHHVRVCCCGWSRAYPVRSEPRLAGADLERMARSFAAHAARCATRKRRVLGR